MSRFKKFTALLFTAIIVISAFAGATSTVKADDEVNTITIGAVKGTYAVPLLVAKQYNLDKNNNASIDVKTYNSTKELNDALKAGEITGAFTDLVNYAAITKSTSSYKIVGQSSGYQGLVANKKYKKVDSLKGKTIAVEKNDASKYYLKTILEDNNLKLSDVKIKEIADPSDRVSQLKSKKVDAIVVGDPFITNAEKNGAKVLKKQNINKSNDNVIIMSKESLSTDISNVNMFINVYNDGIKAFNKGGFTTADQVLVEQGATREAAVKMNDLDIDLSKAKKVKKSDYDRVMKYAKSAKVNTKPAEFKKEFAKLANITK
ncbi:ABC transporter substrate-binding protein [Lactobacillus terrae]|uniref:ABC transporter substrate-binding protein n=1 Tax=Lactobacillus terrae TaxID=2269374 RepID=UPI001472FA4F|nr:ABC transporter substrate-binding protein [Lactobacillus terrae]